MSQAFFGTPARTYTGIELRRSTRIERTVPLFISGRDTAGQDFLERTSAVSINLHGCRYPSRHDLRVGAWITLQLGDAPNSEITTSVRAQVKSVHLPQSPREMHHIGVELETPGNIWSVPSPPTDWLVPLENSFLGNGETAGATGPARSSVLVEMPKPHLVEPIETPKATQSVPDQDAPEAPEEEKAAAPVPVPQVVPAQPKPGRLILTQDQLVNVMRGKLQQAAETAVREAMERQFHPVMRLAIA
ncbi:MAG TPA: hypothetical protein VEU98_02275, partial [Candidatus Eremiobacteraceae bacterium]|nr:hypothetical protein [Candidatus Eremiobacteraceae bacterium]